MAIESVFVERADDVNLQFTAENVHVSVTLSAEQAADLADMLTAAVSPEESAFSHREVFYG